MSRVMGPGDIDRELREIRDSFACGRVPLGDCLQKTFELGRAHERSLSAQQAEPDDKPAPATSGHGGITIQKVEIVVTTNQNPSRIARAVHAELERLSQVKVKADGA